MKNTSYLSLIILLFCASCKNYKLSDSDLAWNPYRVNDKVVFKSTAGAEHKLKVHKVEKSSSKTNPYAGSFSGALEQLVVYYLLENDSEERTLFAMGRTSEGDTFLNFTLNLPDTYHPGSLYYRSAMKQRTVQSFSVNGKSYNDVLILIPENTDTGDDRPYVSKVYWSKSKGFIQYNLSDGEVWKLVD